MKIEQYKFFVWEPVFGAETMRVSWRNFECIEHIPNSEKIKIWSNDWWNSDKVNWAKRYYNR